MGIELAETGSDVSWARCRYWALKTRQTVSATAGFVEHLFGMWAADLMDATPSFPHWRQAGANWATGIGGFFHRRLLADSTYTPSLNQKFARLLQFLSFYTLWVSSGPIRIFLIAVIRHSEGIPLPNIGVWISVPIFTYSRSSSRHWLLLPSLPVQLQRKELQQCAISASIVYDRQAEYRKIIAKLKFLHPKLEVFDSTSYWCNQETCSISRDGSLLYQDQDHLNFQGGQFIAEKFFSWLATVDSRANDTVQMHN